MGRLSMAVALFNSCRSRYRTKWSTRTSNARLRVNLDLTRQRTRIAHGPQVGLTVFSYSRCVLRVQLPLTLASPTSHGVRITITGNWTRSRGLCSMTNFDKLLVLQSSWKQFPKTRTSFSFINRSVETEERCRPSCFISQTHIGNGWVLLFEVPRKLQQCSLPSYIVL
jgi:hypothetical protein